MVAGVARLAEKTLAADHQLQHFLKTPAKNSEILRRWKFEHHNNTNTNISIWGWVKTLHPW